MLTFVKRKVIFSLLFSAFFFAPFILSAETFRVGQCHVVNLKEETDFSAVKKLGLNDSIAIYLPEERLFLEGIEIKMDIPEETAMWRDCCGAYVYDGIRPAPSEQQIDFTGNKIFFGVLPGKLSWVLQIPLKKENSITTIISTQT